MGNMLVSPDMFGCFEETGFLPREAPKKRFLGYTDDASHIFWNWQKLAENLPAYILAGRVDNYVKELDPLPADMLRADSAYVHRAMQILSFIGQACVYEQQGPQRTIPANLAKPWCVLAHRLGRLPVLSYDSYAVHNWKQLDSACPIDLDNIRIIQAFDGGTDEAWFILVHVAIEALAGRCIWALYRAREAAHKNNVEAVQCELSSAADFLPMIPAMLERVSEKCDPYVYYNRVRPYLFGWKDNPAIPDGVVYEGCFGNKPQFFRGETGAQSCVIPALDALLGITHGSDDLTAYLLDMRWYMPTGQRQFLGVLEKNTHILRAYVQEHENLIQCYNHCIQAVVDFRWMHIIFTYAYIVERREVAGNTTAIGTGGTPFLKYLRKHYEDTIKHLL